MKNVSFKFSILAFLFLGVVFAFTQLDTAKPPKFLVIATVQKLTIEDSILQVLRKAYKAQYGKESSLKGLELVKYQGEMYLAFQSGAKGSPTITMKLTEVKGRYIITENTVTNTCTGSPCSWCYFSSSNGCVCNASGGGTCNHTQQGGIKGLGEMYEVLMP